MVKLRVARSIEDGRRLLTADRELGQLAAPTELAKRIEATFGEPLTPTEVVERIVSAVRAEGDTALERYCKLIDGAFHQPLKVGADEMAAAIQETPSDLLDAMKMAAERILEFHRRSVRQSWIESSPVGVFGQLIRPLDRVGLYVPGGTAAYPSSLLMSALPARAAGVPEVIVCTPARGDGKVPAVVLAAAQIAGVSAVYKLGGAQAIAAMAYGTGLIPRVDKILGPGNLFVALAKRMVSGAVGVDSISGPTETLVIADSTVGPEHVAADLLAQAEHDALAQPILITTSPELIEQLPGEIDRQLEGLARASIAWESIEKRAIFILVDDIRKAVQLANEYAPEHLCLEVADPWGLLDLVHSAGGIFLGNRSVEALGDYVAGPSHVMPTGGSARYSSPLTVEDFVKVSSLFAISSEGLKGLGPAAIKIAHAEGFDAHAASIERRLREIS